MEAPRLDDPALRALGARVRVQPSQEFQRAFPSRRPARVTVRLKDGSQLARYRELRRGDSEDPFDWPGLVERMHAFAPGMREASAARLTAWCEGFADPARDEEIVRLDALLFGEA